MSQPPDETGDFIYRGVTVRRCERWLRAETEGGPVLAYYWRATTDSWTVAAPTPEQARQAIDRKLDA